MATLAAQLTSVQAAISAIEGGAQSFTIGDRSYTRANLKTLYDREKSLLLRTERASTQARKVAEF